jgi:membrane protease YdiL (CAAX protease family)
MRRGLLPAAAASAALLGWSNLVVPRLPPGAGARSAANLAATGVLLLAARSAGLRGADLGLAGWRSGARWGAGALALATAGYGVALAVPAGRATLAGAAPVDSTPRQLAVRALLLIPVGTVVCEEVAFRGVLSSLAERQLPPGSAHALTALVFGLWHISPARSQSMPGASVTGTVVLTGFGGMVLGWLRARSGSLLAPMGLHLGTNSVGLLAAVAAQGQSRKTSRARAVSASVQPGGGATIAQASRSWAP